MGRGSQAGKPPAAHAGTEPALPTDYAGVCCGGGAAMATGGPFFFFFFRPFRCGAACQAGPGGAGVARKPEEGVRLRGEALLPPFTYFSPAEKEEVGEGRESG